MRRMIVVSYNLERFDNHNLALRLAALGYTNVYWYRGGPRDMGSKRPPASNLVPQDW